MEGKMRAMNEGEDGSRAWLRFRKLSGQSAADRAHRLAWRRACRRIAFELSPGTGDPDGLAERAAGELRRSLRRLFGLRPSIDTGVLAGAAPSPARPWSTAREAFGFGLDPSGLVLRAAEPRGLLYGVFRLLEAAAVGHLPSQLPAWDEPANPLRMLDHWDNIDGSVERGYAGRSIFFRRGRLALGQAELRRIGAYARLLASVGINAVAINNVNVHAAETRLIADEMLPDVARLAAVLRAWGIRLFLSVNYAAPLSLSGLDTADPLDPRVAAFWAERARAMYRAVPDFGGWLVKADSEGRPGPFTYGRTHADGANMLAGALAPYGGALLWRCFVYNCRQDWRDRRTDRARAAYDHFMPLDGRFAANVALQIKNGPMDFQVREPVSPLLGGMERTNQVLELQATQEYTGQQRHVCCLLPQWQEIFDFAADGADTTVARVASGQAWRRPFGGVAAVANVGDDPNWTGHHLAQVNLYGFGRLAWRPADRAVDLIADWTALTFGGDGELGAAVAEMLANSWSVYESYTAPLGVGWMVNPEHHYGPNVDGYEYSRWGTYHFADRDGIGVDRSSSTGTGYAGLYREPWRTRYNRPETCPDELVLFFHHLRWDYRLRSGKTVVQHIYDSHFAGAEAAKAMAEKWRSLSGRVDSRRHAEVLQRLEHQAAHAEEWRDQINAYCFRKSGVPDERGRTIP
jgi:alpha-glucuronidase